MENNTTQTNEFQQFPKMARLSRDCIISEKIDGTNAQVFIELASDSQKAGHLAGRYVAVHGDFAISAGSRTRWVTPGKDDNYGFAAWVKDNAAELVKLGLGRHFGEWWGSGIQRGYGLPKGEKRLSLFNVSRWCLHGETPQRIAMADPRVEKYQDVLPPCAGLVPVLYRGIFTTDACEAAIADLRANGSKAAPGFMKPEGIVCFHIAANVGFKKTLEKDEAPKSLAR